MSEKEEDKINVEDLIDKKRDEVIAKVKRDTKGLEERIMSDAISHFAVVAEELKQAYSAKVVGPEDLLRTIEKGSYVGALNNDCGYKRLKGKQRVTIIIEPLEKEE